MNDCTAARWIDTGHSFQENTLTSIEAAFALGAMVVEIDVHQTTDGRLPFSMTEQSIAAPKAAARSPIMISPICKTSTSPMAIPRQMEAILLGGTVLA